MASRSRTLAAGALAALALASAAHAMGGPDCAPEDLAPVEAWLVQHPWTAGAVTADARVAAACKPWPFDKRVVIVAAAWAQDKEQDKNLVVALVDTSAGAVRSAFRGVVREDATWSVGQGSLRIDTAPYDLAPGVRAIGIDVASAPVAGTLVRDGVTVARSLFVPDGAQLRLVLDGVVLTTWRKTAAAEPATSSARIALDAHRTNGFTDLRVTRTSNTGRQERTTLVYDGTRYAAGTGWTRHEVEPQP
jgi:hypothetical protein